MRAPRPDLDTCECGDFRRDHDPECRLCRAFPTPWSPECARFRFAFAASLEDILNQERLYGIR